MQFSYSDIQMQCDLSVLALLSWCPTACAPCDWGLLELFRIFERVRESSKNTVQRYAKMTTARPRTVEIFASLAPVKCKSVCSMRISGVVAFCIHTEIGEQIGRVIRKLSRNFQIFFSCSHIAKSFQSGMQRDVKRFK